MPRPILFALAAATALAGATAASAQSYSFETDPPTAYTYNPTNVPGATFNARSGIAAGTFFGTTPPDGIQAAFIQTTDTAGAIALAFSGLTSGQSYLATFYLALRPGYGVNPVTVTFDGQGAGTFVATSNDFTQFTSQAFVAGDTSGSLLFTGSGTIGGDLDVALDLVTIAGATPGAVPEPASWALLIAGFGLTGAALRRRQGATRAALA